MAPSVETKAAPDAFSTNTMAEPSTSGKIPLTLHLTAEVAARLKAAADGRRLSPADLVADLLDRYLPRSPTAGPKKGSIPYS